MTRYATIPVVSARSWDALDSPILEGDCLDVLRELPDCSVDAVVTDPPYALKGGFMGHGWDRFRGCENAGFLYWLTGLIDGEGHFFIKRHTRGTHAPGFVLKMRADELGTLERIHQELRIGTLSVERRDGANPMARWAVHDKRGCERLCTVLDKYPLRAKKRRDYAIWRQAVAAWIRRERGNRWHGSADNAEMEGLRAQLMGTRAFDPTWESRWSGHEFQDWTFLWATEALRVLKPGGHLVAFGGASTSHRLTCGLEDAGFEIRDTLMWLFGSGFPKSRDVARAIDKDNGRAGAQARLAAHIRACREGAGVSRAEFASWFPHLRATTANWERADRHGARVPRPAEWEVLRERLGVSDEFAALIERAEAERVVLGRAKGAGNGSVVGLGSGRSMESEYDVSAPATPEAEQWEGWGTALKPGYEPIVLARKPLAGTVAANVLTHGTGAINVDGCRVTSGPSPSIERRETARRTGRAPGRPGENGTTIVNRISPERYVEARAGESAGRWPANVVLDEEAAELLDEQTGELRSGFMAAGTEREGAGYGGGLGTRVRHDTIGDAGGASRFFYVAKTSRAEREAGLSGAARPVRPTLTPTSTLQRGRSGGRIVGEVDRAPSPIRNVHPTVKPIALMRWLLRMVTPPRGVVLDLFAGSGSTVCAGACEGIAVVGIEREPEYVAIARARAAWWAANPHGPRAATRRSARTAPAPEAVLSLLDDLDGEAA